MSADIGIGRFGVNPFRNDDFKADVWTQIGWDKDIAQSYVDTLAQMEESKNRVFPLRVPELSKGKLYFYFPPFELRYQHMIEQYLYPNQFESKHPL